MFKSSLLLIAIASVTSQSLIICTDTLLIQEKILPTSHVSVIPTVCMDNSLSSQKKTEFMASKLSSALCSMQTAKVISTTMLAICGTVGAVWILDLLIGNHTPHEISKRLMGLIADVIFAAPFMVIHKSVKNAQEEIKEILKNDIVESELQF